MVNWLHALSYQLLPGRCQLCAAPSRRQRDLCTGCEADLPWLGVHCPRCALPLERPAGGEVLCGQCLRRPPAFAGCRAAWQYGYPLDQMINGFKHRRRHDLGALLAELWLQRQALADSGRPELLVPVPLHWRRQLWRGFNQAERLAQHWGRHWGIPVADALRRVKPTPAQQQLDAAGRRRNLRGAFALRQPQAVRGRHIALVDDVVTTGATAQALADILGRAGARRVEVWCLARTP